MVDIAFQHPSLGAVLAIVVQHVPLEPHEAVVGALPFLAGVVIPDEAAGHRLIHDVVGYRMEDNFVNEGRGLDEPFLWLIDEKRLELAGLVGLGVENVGQSLGVGEHIGLVLGRGRLIPFPLSGLQIRLVQYLEGTHLLVGHAGPSLLRVASSGRGAEGAPGQPSCLTPVCLPPSSPLRPLRGRQASA